MILGVRGHGHHSNMENRVTRPRGNTRYKKIFLKIYIYITTSLWILLYCNATLVLKFTMKKKAKGLYIVIITLSNAAFPNARLWGIHSSCNIA